MHYIKGEIENQILSWKFRVVSTGMAEGQIPLHQFLLQLKMPFGVRAWGS